MMQINKQAEELSNILKQKAPNVYGLLSDSGKNAFFPKQGILAQTAEATETEINATIGQAFEDDSSPMVLDSFSEQVKLPKTSFLYSPSYGQQELRGLWQKHIFQENPSLKADTTLPVVTNALTHGLSVVNKLFVNDGDEIIIPVPFWGNYKLIFDKAKFNQFDLFKENKFNIDALKEKLEENGKKILLLNFPNNPTGYTPTEEEVKEIINAIRNSAEKGNNILVICDDAYFGLVYEQGISKESIFAKLADLHENILAIKLDGITKEAYAWGLRVGFITYGFKGISEQTALVLEDKTAGVVRGTISNACTHSQLLAINGLKSPGFLNQKKEKFNELKQRYEIVKQTLEKNKNYKEFFEPLPFNSGYFMCIELKKDANEIREKLIKEFNTGVISIDNLLRIAYSAVSKKDIPKLFENICNACK